jgi:alkylated DNA nucleotide flippase Atl1
MEKHMAGKRTWQEKLLDSKDLPKIVTLKENAQIHWNAKTMAIPSPLEVNEIMYQIPEGKLITIDGIRKIVAQKHRADIGCPLTCGIFSWIAAHTANEAESQGKKNVTPYWRTLKTGGELNPKYPGGIEDQKKRLESEGFRVVQKGKKFRVENYEEYL